MKARWFVSLAAVLGSATLASAQAPDFFQRRGPTVPAAAGSPVLPAPAPDLADDGTWFTAEYLLWQIKNAPNPVPLITTGNPNDPIPGALGQPGTQVIFGGSSIYPGTFSGGRFGAGTWLGDERLFGVEASFFFLPQLGTHFHAASDGTGTPALYRPLFNVLANTDRPAVISASDSVLAGSVTTGTSARLWGMEFNGLVNLYRDAELAFSALIGFRYLDFQETLGIDYSKRILANGADFFLGNTFTDGNFFISDSFLTKNQFYGGQIGGRVTYQLDRLSLTAVGKVAFGATHEVVDVRGSTLFTAPGFVGTASGGALALPSNIGRNSQSSAGVLPEVNLNVGYQVTPALRVFVGYSFLYLSEVVRPGDQISRAIDPRQFPSSALFQIGETRAVLRPPGPGAMHGSDFWAQGINLGVQLRF